jgi:hypothetical protein
MSVNLTKDRKILFSLPKHYQEFAQQDVLQSKQPSLIEACSYRQI